MAPGFGRARTTAWVYSKTESGRFIRLKDGLAHRAVLSLALDKRTGDVWAGTMGGLSRISGGRIVSYTQLNSGLSNDVVYGVSVEGENVWVATASGAGRLNLDTGEWSLYNERNTPMREIWVYGVSATATKVYFRRLG
jgi:ligand-binding sensor domain-containing protein